MGNVLLSEAGNENTVKPYEKQLGVALNFYGVSLILLLASYLLLAFLRYKVVIERLNELIGMMPLIALIVSMHLMVIAVPKKRVVKYARNLSFLSLFIKINSTFLAMFSAHNGVEAINAVLSVAFAIILILAEGTINYGITNEIKEKDRKLSRSYDIVCIVEYSIICFIISCVISTNIANNKIGGYGDRYDFIINTIILILIVLALIAKIEVIRKATKLFQGGKACSCVRKSLVIMVMLFLVLTAFMHAHQFNLKYAYDKAYDIWASGYIEGHEYSGKADISSFAINMANATAGNKIVCKTYDELVEAAQNDGRGFITIDADADLVKFVGEELHAYRYLSGEERTVMQEIINVSYKFPKQAVTLGTYEVTLDDGYVLPVVISDKLIESKLENGNGRVEIPCFEIIGSEQITDFYADGYGFHKERYENADLWVIGEAAGTRWMDVVYDYCLENYSIARCAIYLTLAGIAIAFIVWFGTKDSTMLKQ